jgi:hypothetical protein
MASKLKEAKQGINSVRFSAQGEDGKSKIPEGAEILNTTTSVDVEEIENGFIICKRVETKYMAPGKEYSDWNTETKKYYSKENPLSISVEDKELADMFDE